MLLIPSHYYAMHWKQWDSGYTCTCRVAVMYGHGCTVCGLSNTLVK